MKRFVVTFKDWIEVDNEEEAYDKLLDYLADCVDFRDVTAFEFEEELADETEV